MSDWKDRSLFNGVRDVASSTVFGTVLRPYWREILIVLLLLIVIVGGSRAIANDAKAKVLEKALEDQRARFEHIIQENDRERDAIEKAFSDQIKDMQKDYEKSKRTYQQRIVTRKRWKKPEDILRTAKRFRALGFDALMNNSDGNK
jgi:hypothetical protein